MNNDNELENIDKSNMDFVFFIKDYLQKKYIPANDITKVLMLSTADIFNSLQWIYPSTKYSAEMVAEWLNESKFKIIDVGNMRFLWLIQEVE